MHIKQLIGSSSISPNPVTKSHNFLPINVGNSMYKNEKTKHIKCEASQKCLANLILKMFSEMEKKKDSKYLPVSRLFFPSNSVLLPIQLFFSSLSTNYQKKMYVNKNKSQNVVFRQYVKMVVGGRYGILLHFKNSMMLLNQLYSKIILHWHKYFKMK